MYLYTVFDIESMYNIQITNSLVVLINLIYMGYILYTVYIFGDTPTLKYKMFWVHSILKHGLAQISNTVYIIHTPKWFEVFD